jgi:hypothetical protein
MNSIPAVYILTIADFLTLSTKNFFAYLSITTHLSITADATMIKNSSMTMDSSTVAYRGMSLDPGMARHLRTVENQGKITDTSMVRDSTQMTHIGITKNLSIRPNICRRVNPSSVSNPTTTIGVLVCRNVATTKIKCCHFQLPQQIYSIAFLRK